MREPIEKLPEVWKSILKWQPNEDDDNNRSIVLLSHLKNA